MTKRNLFISLGFISMIVLGFFVAQLLSRLTAGPASPKILPIPGINPDISVYFPQPYQEISSPFQIMGNARGRWYFEAVFPIRLLDASGKEIARVQGRASGDWMTQDFVPFSAVLVFDKPATKAGVLRFMNDNPSGDPAKQKYFDVPVVFK